MRVVNWLCLGGVVLAGGSLVAAYGLAGVWQWSWIWIALALGWWLGRARSWAWASWAGLGGLILGAAAGLLLAANPFWMLGVTAVALVAWDLDGLDQRLAGTEPDAALRSLVRNHLNKLGAVAVAGFGAAALAMSLQLQVGFWVIAAAVLLLAIGLSRAFALMSR
jgi:hypothetical protein